MVVKTFQRAPNEVIKTNMSTTPPDDETLSSGRTNDRHGFDPMSMGGSFGVSEGRRMHATGRFHPRA